MARHFAFGVRDMISGSILSRIITSTGAVHDSIRAPSSFMQITGEANVLAWHTQLSALAKRCGQDEAMAFMTHTFSQLVATNPVLLLLLNRAAELEAAVLLREYHFKGFHTGVFIPTDYAGERDVVAPSEVRAVVAQQAAEYLIQHGAKLVLVALQHRTLAQLSKTQSSTATYSATLTCDASRTLLLASTFDATLARFGGHTRRNLRLFRRRAQTELGASFVVNAQLTQAEFLTFNRQSSYPVRPSIACWRYRSIQTLSGSFVAGVRTNDGRWLSLIGGRRYERSTHIDWQLNNESLSSLSPRTVMRSFLLEYEVSRGTERITFEGGTTHSINRAFLPETVTHLLLTQPPLSPFVCRNLLARILPENNLLANTLQNKELQWQT